MLHHYLGSDQKVADLLNKMSRGLLMPLNTYFSSTWTFLAFLGGIMGILSSIVQAYYSIFPRDNKRAR
ncbi:hypothetical protein PTKIN_Ptkin15bG0036600 [Pterospermum kingtungense]